MPGPRSPTPARTGPCSGASLALAIVLVSGLLAACGGSSPKIAKLPALHPGRTGPESIFTTGSDLLATPGPVLNELKKLGVDRVHLSMGWGTVAPDAQSFKRPDFDAADPSAYPAAGWAPYDAAIRGLAARHIGIDLALAPQAPFWAEGPGDPQRTTQPSFRPSASDYEQWVTAVGRRYSGHYTPPGATSPLPRVSFWSVWNEPDLGVFLAPETPHAGSPVEVAAGLYRGLVNAAWDALHATGHSHDTILIGETAPAGSTFRGAPGVFGDMPPLRFLRALYCVDSDYRQLRGSAATARGCPATAAGSATFAARNPGLFKATGFADHPYSFTSLPPDVRTPNQPDYAELAAIPTLEQALDRMQALYGSHTKFAIWSTEFGYITNPPNQGYTITPKLAAEYLNWSEYISWSNPRIKSYDQYLLEDPPTANGFATGLETATGLPKPALAAFRMPLYLPVAATAKGHPLVVWGCVRPAPDAAAKTRRTQSVLIQFRPGLTGSFQTVQRVPLTNPHGYFEVHQTFPASGQVRLRWAYPNGVAIDSRTADVTLR